MIQNKNACNLQHSGGLNDAEQDLSDENNIISSSREAKESNNDAKSSLTIDIKILDRNNSVQNCIPEKECMNLKTNNDVSTNGQMCKDEMDIPLVPGSKDSVIDTEYLDKNYGNFFIIWDRMFGTYAEEKEPVIYGLKDNVNTFNPLKITSFSWKSFFKDFKKSKTFRDKILSFCGSPEWTPILAPIKKHN